MIIGIELESVNQFGQNEKLIHQSTSIGMEGWFIMIGNYGYNYRIQSDSFKLTQYSNRLKWIHLNPSANSGGMESWFDMVSFGMKSLFIMIGNRNQSDSFRLTQYSNRFKWVQLHPYLANSSGRQSWFDMVSIGMKSWFWIIRNYIETNICFSLIHLDLRCIQTDPNRLKPIESLDLPIF